MGTITKYSEAYTYKSTYKYRAMLKVTTSETAAKVTISWRIEAQAYMGYSYGIGVKGGGAISGSAAGYFTESNKPGQTWKMVPKAYKTGSFSIDKAKSKQSKTLTATPYGTSVNGIGSAGGTGKSTSITVDIPALASYTITYNSNGGSGAPGASTKYYGKTLTLSSTKPTRTGYTFLGWGTSSTATSVAYKPGGSYTANSKATLYAIWKANTYTISYNANGGAGAPGPQTKTYGVAISLSPSKPIRTYYLFLGWATSASATSVKFAPGARYTDNNNQILYAVWKYNGYKVQYNLNTGGGTIPTAQEAAVNTSITLSNGTGITAPSGKFLDSWNTASNGKGTRYGLGQLYKQTVADANPLVLYARYETSYVAPTIQFAINRIDTFGNYSTGGKRAELSYIWSAGKDINGYHSGSLKVQYPTGYNSETGEYTWGSYDNGSKDFNFGNNSYAGSNSFILENLNSYNWPFRIMVTDTSTTNPNSIYSNFIFIPDYDENNFKEVALVDNTFQASRLSKTSTTAIFSFDWTPYYDGNEYYSTSTVFTVKASLYKGKEEEYEGDLSVQVTGVYDNELNVGKVTGYITGILQNRSAKIYIDSVTSTSENSDLHTYVPSVKTIRSIISYGGFPVHINPTAEGISLFGIADDLVGFEVNSDAKINNTLTVDGTTVLKNIVNINNTLTISASEDYGVFIKNSGTSNNSGIHITRDDKNYHLFTGIGSGGDKHGIYSSALGGWIINALNTNKSIYIDLNNKATNLYIYPKTIFPVSRGASWWNGRDCANLKTQTSSNEYIPTLSLKTKSGDWTIGTYTSERLTFVYTSDTQYGKKTNGTTHLWMSLYSDGQIGLGRPLTRIGKFSTSTFTNTANGSYSKDLTLTVPSGYELVGIVGVNQTHNEANTINAAYRTGSNVIRVVGRNLNNTSYTNNIIYIYVLFVQQYCNVFDYS